VSAYTTLNTHSLWQVPLLLLLSLLYVSEDTISFFSVLAHR